MRATKLIPDAITAMNVVCGIIAVVFAFKGNFDAAFFLMLLAAVFDFFDGFAARALDAWSPMGKELDSLCDLVSFGVLPSIMLYRLMCVCRFGETRLCWIPLTITVCSALRLAKFNVDERQHETFLGLPTPACAILCASLCHFIAHNPECFLADWAAGNVFIPLLSIVLSILLVCEIPMFSMKIKIGGGLNAIGWKRISFVLLVLAITTVAAFFRLSWSFVPLASFALYIVKNIVYLLFRV